MSLGKLAAFGAAWARLRAGWSWYASMQLEGAWMMKAPVSRALVRNSSIRGTISSSRRTALRQWWASHMSQTMTAVFGAGHCCGFSATVNLPSDSVRERRLSEKLESSARTRPGRTSRAAQVRRMGDLGGRGAWASGRHCPAPVAGRQGVSRRLHAADVNQDVALVEIKVGERIDAVAPVEAVGPGPARQRVRLEVARAAVEPVVPVPAVQVVRSLTAVQVVVAGTPIQIVVARVAYDRIVPGPARQVIIAVATG